MAYFYGFLLCVVVFIHFAFILYVPLGGYLVFRWRLATVIHFPALVYGALISFFGWVCPLTPLEIWLRERAGMAAYEGGFIDHYITLLIYPEGLTRRMQILLGLLAILMSIPPYVWSSRRYLP